MNDRDIDAKEFFDDNGLVFFKPQAYWCQYLGSKIHYKGHKRTMRHFKTNGVEISFEEKDFIPDTTGLSALQPYIEIRIKAYLKDPSQTEKLLLNNIIKIFNMRSFTYKFPREWWKIK